ncbi:peptidoglycan amidohydrolase family protein [Furfurilactobacillus sp. WILCCON 0119]
MSVDTNAVIQWFRDREGQLTYSMYGSRNGSDGTADCSGSMTEALYQAGAGRYSYLYSTETIHEYLKANGFECIVENDQNGWNAQPGDIVIWGQRGSSAGAGGHIMVMTSGDPDNNCISTCYYTGGEEGTAVQELGYDYFASLDGYPYYYVYRLTGNGNEQTPTPQPVPAPSRDKSAVQQFKDAGGWVKFNGHPWLLDQVEFTNGCWQGLSHELSADSSSDQLSWDDNGVPLVFVSLTDNLNQNDATPGNHFKFDKDEWLIADYDEGSNAIAIDLGADYGLIWFNADACLKA